LEEIHHEDVIRHRDRARQAETSKRTFIARSKEYAPLDHPTFPLKSKVDARLVKSVSIVISAHQPGVIVHYQGDGTLLRLIWI
jgi:hypothetical protein